MLKADKSQLSCQRMAFACSEGSIKPTDGEQGDSLMCGKRPDAGKAGLIANARGSSSEGIRSWHVTSYNRDGLGTCGHLAGRKKRHGHPSYHGMMRFACASARVAWLAT